MKIPQLRPAMAIVLAALLLVLPGPAAARTAKPAKAAATAGPADPGWPRFYEKEGNTLTVYQPQVTSWEKYRELNGRAAFELVQADAPKAIGVVNFTAKTAADTAAHTVTVKKISIDDVRFASLDEEAEKKAKKAFEKLFPREGTTISLDRVLANLERTTAPVPKIEVKNDPPKIFVMNEPAVLLFVDGDPVYAPIEGISMKYVVNTNWDLFWNETTSHYYLLDDMAWRTSQKLDGDWVPVRTLPADMSKLPSGQNFDDVKKMIPPPAVKAPAVKIVYTDEPAEIVVFDGTPVWVDVPGTGLAFVKNTEADFFLQKSEGQYYYLVSGRWFRSKSTEGPWTFATADLPEDFRRIPPKSPKASVLASVPGTQEAADAVLLAQIPTTVVVNKAEAEKGVRIQYVGGDPQFKAIEGTSMSYATNTQAKVVKLNDLYYLCYQGVWFVGKDANGPWTVLDEVPDEIYTIPASSPLYNVTYVTASNPTDTTVEYSYTSGYMGSFVVGFGVGACVMWGTGWYYPPYYWYGGYYPVYWPYPYAYGYGAWYNSATGRYGYGGAVYGPYGMAGGAAWYNSSTGRYGRMSTVQTPWGGRTWSSSYNPYTGVASARAGGWNAYGSWGSTAISNGDGSLVSNRVSNADGTVRRTTGSGGGSMTKIRTDQGTVRVGQDANNNVYAGKDGNVYKRDQSGNWSKYENGGWSSVDKPQRPSGEGGTKPAGDRPSRGQGSVGQGGGGNWGGSDVSRDLNRDASARSRGSEMSRSYSGASRSWSGGMSRGGFSGGGGGFRGGGRR
jgi:hypothetical protein